MQLTHANVVMAALPADRSARNPADKTRRDYIYKVGCQRVCFGVVCMLTWCASAHRVME
jgi:hypothetical protein